MTTVENVLIYEALERNKIYKENKKKELSNSKRKLKLQKASEKAVTTVTKIKIKKTERPKVVTIRKRKIKTKSRSQLVKELDAIFSRYIRLRDADKNGICSCITCGEKIHRKNIQNWHFITRGNYKYRRSVVNCWSQCMPCNIYKSGNYIAYTLAMIWKYWEWIVREMQEDKELVKISTPEIREMIEKYKYEIELLMKVKDIIS